MAFISLFADIAISTITVLSLKFGELYFVGLLFIINYLLTVIVVISLIFIFGVFFFSHYRKVVRAFEFFRFEDKPVKITK